MDRKGNKIVLIIMTLYILIAIPILNLIMSYYNVNIGNQVNINSGIVLYISVPILLYTYIREKIKEDRRFNVFDYLILILVISGIISCLFADHKMVAIFGNDFRHEGFLSVLSYYLLFLNYKEYGSNKDIKNLKYYLYIWGVLNAIYAFLQVYTNLPFIVRFREDSMASGLCGNPNFLGSLIVTIISILTCEILLSKKVKIRYYLLLTILFVALIDCQSTGPFLAYIVLIVFLVIYLIAKKKFILGKFIILIIMLPSIYLLTYLFNNYMFTHLKVDNKCELCEIDTTIETGGTYRLTIWEYTFEIMDKYFLVGTGYDNLLYVFPHQDYKRLYEESIYVGSTFDIKNRLVDDKDISEKAGIIDNAHNVYLHIWISNGIISLIPYLILCLFVFIKGIKNNSTYDYLLISAFVAYSVQAFVNLSVIQVAPIYYIIMGLICRKEREKEPL